MSQLREWDSRYETGQTPWDSGKPSEELQRILAEREVQPCRALELGCGTGTNAIFLAQRGFTVTALDVSPLAIDKARQKAQTAGVSVDFRVADALALPDLGPAFPFVFDRGVYHHLRTVNLVAFLATLSRVTKAGGLYLTLAGNANDKNAGQGPPCVHAHELCQELASAFELVQLREFDFSGIVVDGKPMAHRGWSALMRRRSV